MAVVKGGEGQDAVAADHTERLFMAPRAESSSAPAICSPQSLMPPARPTIDRLHDLGEIRARLGVLLAFTAVAAVVCALFLGPRTTSNEDGNGQSTTIGTDPVSSGPPQNGALTDGPEPGTQPLRADGSSAWTGRFVDTFGVPLSGIEITVLTPDGVELETATDSSGDFLIELPPAHGTPRLLLAEHPDFSSRWARLVDPNEGSSLADHTLDTGLDLAVAVVDQEGAAIPDAEIRLEQTQVVLSPAVDQEWLDTAPDGRFLARTALSHAKRSGVAQVRSNEAGTALLTHLSPGSYRLTVWASGHAAQQRSVQLRSGPLQPGLPNPQSDPLDGSVQTVTRIQLEGARLVAGKILHATGHGVSRIRVEAHPQPRVDATTPPGSITSPWAAEVGIGARALGVTTDENGAFRLDHLPLANPLLLTADVGNGFGTLSWIVPGTQSPSQPTESEPEDVSWTLELPSSQEVRGRIEDSNGRPMAGCTIQIPRPRGLHTGVSGPIARLHASATTLRDGGFILRGVPTGRIQALVRSKSGRLLGAPWTFDVPTDADPVFRLPPNGTVRGSVRPTAPNATLPNPVIRLLDPDSRRTARTATADADGAFEVADVVPGRYELHVAAPGFLDWNAEISVESGETPEHSVTLSRGGFIVGRCEEASPIDAQARFLIALYRGQESAEGSVRDQSDPVDPTKPQPTSREATLPVEPPVGDPEGTRPRVAQGIIREDGTCTLGPLVPGVWECIVFPGSQTVPPPPSTDGAPAGTLVIVREESNSTAVFSKKP